MFCTECGKELNSAARFCGKCGAPVTISAEDINGDSNLNNKRSQSNSSSAGPNQRYQTGSNRIRTGTSKPPVSKGYDPGFAQSRKDKTTKPKNGDKKVLYLYTSIFTLFVFLLKGAGAYGSGYAAPIALILFLITAIPNRIIRWFVFILFGAFFWLIVLFPSD